MRFLGPRSISSLLKTALDVVYFGLFSLVVALILVAISLLIVPNLAAEVARRLNLALEMSASSQAVMLLAFAVSLSGYLLIMHWTRQVFSTLPKATFSTPTTPGGCAG